MLILIADAAISVTKTALFAAAVVSPDVESYAVDLT